MNDSNRVDGASGPVLAGRWRHRPAGLGWYARRMARMSPAELVWRAHDQGRRLAWTRSQVRPGGVVPPPSRVAGAPAFTATLPPGTAELVPAAARAALLASADELMAGRWETLWLTRTDLADPDWFTDPSSGRRSDPAQYAFNVRHRSPEHVGDVKQVWELSRLQHLTVLSAAWYLTHDDAYADRAAGQLRSWWRANPFLSGVHWTSGIELGLRLISFAWIRRLLDGWPGAPDLFERNPLALNQIRWHQRYLATFRSRGSSANNHVIAEAAGQLVASCAFGWFAESGSWRRSAARLLEPELTRNTFPSGVNRELAADYHCFVAELGFAAAAEAEASGHPLSQATWQRLAAMADSAAALLDAGLNPPRYGDSDEGRGLVLDAPEPNRWPGLLALAAPLVGPRPWWPEVTPTVLGALLPALILSPAPGEQRPGVARAVSGRAEQRPYGFADAGVTILRAGTGAGEIWCRCDGGPHGFLSIAAHAHADALSVEVRRGGVEILADPGTYCYHGEPDWRTYFRSTIGHNTAEVAGRSQSAEGGPFLWSRHAKTTVTEATASRWAAEHSGYTVLDPPVTHRRGVDLDERENAVMITDELDGNGHQVRLAFHLGPHVTAELDGTVAELSWPARDGMGAAALTLPGELRWSAHRGETDPILGWYSPGLGRRVPATTLVGEGRLDGSGLTLKTCLRFRENGTSPKGDASRQAVSWFTEIHAEAR